MVRYGRRNGDALSGPKSSISCEGGGVGATKPGRYNGVYAKEMSINARIQSARDRSTQKRARTHYIFRIVNLGLSAFIRKVFRSLSASSDVSV